MNELTFETAVRGTIIVDRFCHEEEYLIFFHDTSKNSLHCLTSDFNIVYLSTDWLSGYLVKGKIDIDKLITRMGGGCE